MRLARVSIALGLALATGVCGPATRRECPPGVGGSRDLWQRYASAPDVQRNVPNVSFAGYRQGEAPLPEPPVVADVRAFGARGDGRSDDWKAFEAAQRQAAEAGGGAVLVPPGTYRLGAPLHLRFDGVVLRGAGRAASVLEFERPLADVLGELTLDRRSQWSWAGGQVWIGPADTFAAGRRPALADSPLMQAWEAWRPGPSLARVTAAAPVGARELEVDAPQALRPGALVLLSWDNPVDASLLQHVAGHPAFQAYPWPSARWILPPHLPRLLWPVRIESVSGRRVRLTQPLRLEARAQWDLRFLQPGPSLRGAGIEHVTLRLRAPPRHAHLENRGHNGIYVNRAYDCFVRDVDVVDAENGVILAAAKNVTVSGVRLLGPAEQHHSLACRVSSHDCLFEDFVVDGPQRVRHGINTEWLSSGNVWRRGRLARGTFDSHRGLSFDSLRTDIELSNDEGSSPGGAPPAGPFLGKRMVHWNVRIVGSDREDPGAYVNQPNALPLGALVGVQGAPLSRARVAGVVAGRKDCLVLDDGRRPDPPDLYAAELALRLRTEGRSLLPPEAR